MPDKRIASCMTAVRTDWGQVEIRQSADSGRCYYAGLMACGSVWICPLCATKIQAVRALELKAAIAEGQSQGLTVAMLAPTVSHTLQDDLGSLLDDYTRALSSLLRGRGFRKLKERYGIEGYVRALEVTYGFKNGWHPHAHVLFFLRPDSDLAALESDLFPLWEKAVRGRGLGEVSRRPFKLESATYAHNYVTKLGREWGPAEELVHSHSKSASGESFSPFDLLAEYTFRSASDSKRAQFGALFREYANVFHGRRQLQWTQGLKKRLVGADGLTDAEIADSLGQVDAVLAVLTLDDWLLVRKADYRGEVLLIAELDGVAGIRDTLDALRRGLVPEAAARRRT
jgi:hypothetical protein